MNRSSHSSVHYNCLNNRLLWRMPFNDLFLTFSYKLVSIGSKREPSFSIPAANQWTDPALTHTFTVTFGKNIRFHLYTYWIDFTLFNELFDIIINFQFHGSSLYSYILCATLPSVAFVSLNFFFVILIMKKCFWFANILSICVWRMAFGSEAALLVGNENSFWLNKKNIVIISILYKYIKIHK